MSPSISQRRLDEMAEEREQLKATADDLRGQSERWRERVVQTDRILEKIVRAAQGLSLSDERGFANVGGYMSPLMEANGQRKLKTEERQEQEIRSLNDRIVSLESRLAAVVAVATFAKAHKS